MSILEDTQTKPMPGFSFYKETKWLRVSALNEFIRCPRKFFYHYGVGLIPTEDRLALVFGEALHAGIGWLCRHPCDLKGSLDAFQKVWTPDKENLSDELGDKHRKYATAILLLGQYIDQHSENNSIYIPIEPPTAQTGLRPEDHQSDMELAFAINIGCPIPIVGRIDGLCRHRDTGETWLLEFKTASDFSWRLNFFDSFRMNTQLLSYNVAAKIMGINARGTIVEGFKVHSTKPEIQLSPVYVQSHMIDDHLKLMRLKVAELIELEKRMDFYKNFGGCNPYALFGQTGFMCEYEKLCQCADWQQLKDIYKKEENSPFYMSQLEEQK